MKPRRFFFGSIVLPAFGLFAFSGSVQAANTTYTLTTTATGNWSTTGNWAGGNVGNGVGNIAQLGAGGVTLTLDTARTIGVILDGQGSARNFTVNASGSLAMTMDNSGATANNAAGDKNAFIGSTSSGAVTFQPNIIISNTDLDLYLAGSTTPNLTIGVNGGSSTITATTAQSLNLMGNASSGSRSITVYNSIGSTGSAIAVKNVGNNLTVVNLNGALGGNTGTGAAVTVANTSTGAGTLTIAGSLGQSVSTVTQNSTTSTLTLSNANTNYAGTTNLTSGTIKAGAATNVGSVVFGGASTNGTLDLGGFAVGAIGLSTTGAGTLSSQLIGNSSTANHSTLTYTSGTTTFGGIIQNVIGSGNKTTALTVNSGALTLTGGNTYTGNTQIDSGATLQLGNAAGTGALSTSSAIVTNGTFAINRTNAVAQGTDFSSAAITGTGGFAQGGANTTTLNAANTYSGNTTVSAGTLALSHASANNIASSSKIDVKAGAILNVAGLNGGSGGITLTTGKTLTGSGTVAGGTVTTVSGAIITPGLVTAGNAGSGVLTMGNLTLDSGSIFNFGLNASNPLANYADAQVLTLPGSGVVLNLYNPGTATPFAATGTYDLFKYTSGVATGALPGIFSIGVGAAGYTPTFSANGTYVQLTLTASGVIGTWTNVNANGNWSEAGNWSGGVPSAAGDSATFGATAPGTVNLDANETVGSIAFNNASAFTISGGNTLTLNNSGSPASISVATGSHTINTAVALTDNLAVTPVSGSQLSLSGIISNTGGAKTLTMNGAGTLVLSNANTYGPASAGTVGTTLSGGGTTQVGNNTALGAGDVSFAGSATLQSGAAGLSVANNVALSSGATATVDTQANTLTLPGNITDNAGAGGGTGAVTKLGSGTLILGGTNNYGGGTTLTNGTLNVSADANLGATAGSVRFNGGTLQLSATIASSARSYVISNGQSAIIDTNTFDLTNDGVVSSLGSSTTSAADGLIKNGAGTLTLGGPNTYTGQTVINNGTVAVGNSLGLQSSTVNVGASGALVFTTPTTATIAGLTGSGSVSLTNTGASAAVALTVGNSNATTNYSGNLSGLGSLTKVGSGTLTLSNANYSGGTTVTGATLTVTGGSFGSGSSNILVGNGGGAAFLNVSGGSVTANVLNVGTNSGSTGSSASITGNASATFAAVNNGSTNNTGANITINTTGTVDMGVVTLNRDTGTNNTKSNPTGGLIINAGTVTATSIEENSSTGSRSADLNLNGGSLTISAATNGLRLATGAGNGALTMTGGTLSYLGSDGLLAGMQNTTSTNTSTISITGATSVATLTGITLNAISSTVAATSTPAGPNSTLVVDTGATLYLGAVGLVGNNPGASSVSATFGTATVGAYANWTSTVPITLTGTTTFKAADAANAPFSIGLSGALSGAGGLTKTGAGALTLAGPNTYTGSTTVSKGALTAANNSALGSSSAATAGLLLNPTTGDTATVNFTSAAPAIASLASSGAGTSNVVLGNTTTPAATTLSAGGNNASTTFGGVISDLTLTDAAAIGNVTKVGSGVLTFTGANTYTGSTTIDGGTLSVAAGGSLASAVTVNNTGKLTGSGAVGGATIIESGGKHSAGDPGVNAGVGSQAFGSTLNYANGSIFEWDLNASDTTTGFDTVSAAGAIDVGTTGTVFRVLFGTTAATDVQNTNNLFWNTPFITQTWAMADIFGAAFNSGAFQTVETSFDVSSHGSFTINGSSLTWSAVPEPTTALAGLLLGAGALRRRRPIATGR